MHLISGLVFHSNFRMLEEKEEPGFLTGLKIPAPWAAGKTVETVHPVRDNYKFKETVHIPGARCLYLRFDNRCSSQYDYDKVSGSQIKFFLLYIFPSAALGIFVFSALCVLWHLISSDHNNAGGFIGRSLLVCTLMSWSPYFKAVKYGAAERLFLAWLKPEHLFKRILESQLKTTLS